MFFLVLLSAVCMPVLLGSKSLINLLVINICCEPSRVIFMLLFLRALKIIQTLLIFILLCEGGSCEDAPSVMIHVWNPWLGGCSWSLSWLLFPRPALPLHPQLQLWWDPSGTAVFC